MDIRGIDVFPEGESVNWFEGLVVAMSSVGGLELSSVDGWEVSVKEDSGNWLDILDIVTSEGFQAFLVDE